MSRRRGGVGGTVTVLFLVFVPVAGWWWWLTGLPMSGNATRGWVRAGTVAGRASILSAMLWWAYLPGALHWWGTFGMLGCAAAGWLARSRRHVRWFRRGW